MDREATKPSNPLKIIRHRHRSFHSTPRCFSRLCYFKILYLDCTNLASCNLSINLTQQTWNSFCLMFEMGRAAPFRVNRKQTERWSAFECFSIPGCCTGNEGDKDARFSTRINGCNANPSFSSG